MTDSAHARVPFVVAISPSLADRFSAADIARALAAAGHGGGGGRADFAQGSVEADRWAEVERAFWALMEGEPCK